ncbi:poly(hydroxyalkanoate) granule-associated protein [Rhizobium leguminosarum]|uniref:poly(hydroxyalkanoate) granule-associated protein n=1 Tax=Rhizobium leguminosarum TaxID=384 RepID=UPI0014428647|nr:poly(hydroxyalkanoate) granule-associated protein [Rhizobium leguminosarum]NKL08111.1 poly(hydroxyalkanoate) granule-associated protein [Rhizobium leguminosarum bv. viciae]NKL85070.1 poly(hydroxyalkanoate) granule-associated protein [Rhizobium leguminosarum bv. viciae]NKL90316.1 poly(hydroxyalkanoate) granule-associated protein [Rhizobium leguminosarum bv. viciae]NKM93658.1 poly(hydroxyalkanoate) granule-associated protein [Rhizobium leguminosarum bv. viciae]
MIRYAASAAGNPQPPKAREVSAAESAVEMPRTKPVIEVASAGAALAAYPLLPSGESDEFGSDALPKATKRPRRAATKRKPKVAETDDTPLQLNLEA